MSSPVIVFPDPVPLVKALVIELLAAHGTPATVSTKAPPKSPESSSLPYVQVQADSRSRDARLNGRAVMRLLVWGRDAGQTADLAGLIEALLDSARTTAIRGFSPIALIPTDDPDTGAPMAALTITARLRPRQL